MTQKVDAKILKCLNIKCLANLTKMIRNDFRVYNKKLSYHLSCELWVVN